jgi:hypothetical protein
MEKIDAVEKGTLSESYRSEHPDRDTRWSTAKAGHRHRLPKSGKVAPR